MHANRHAESVTYATGLIGNRTKGVMPWQSEAVTRF